jgi:hypothetical protein
VRRKVGILQQRCIEATVIRSFYTKLAREHGVERSRALVLEVIHELAFEQGRKLLNLHPAGDLSVLAAHWQNLSEGGALEIGLIQQSHDCLQFRVSRCGYVAAYQQMGIGSDLAAILSCSRDESLLKGFSDEIVLERSRTIMEGSKYCEFTYRVKK